ncbi:MAG TPA: hypothetical protein VLN44_06185 [Pyrinomonadaceae bacterium]|nr:hypothetical protein [Pyrinomonadaceae bacterium]
MKSELSRLLQRRPKRRKGDPRELAARLAPLEEQRPADAPGVSVPSNSAELVTQERGAIVVGNHKPSLPKDLIEVDGRKGFRALEPVVLVIAGLMLAFIIFIAWQISRM